MGQIGAADRLVGRNAAHQVGRAVGIVPVRRVVVDHAKVGTADDFEVIGQAGVPDREEVGCQVFLPGHLVDEGRIAVADDLFVSMVFHHDQEHMIEVGNAGPMLVMLVGHGRTTRDGCGDAQGYLGLDADHG